MEWFVRDFDHPAYFEIYQDKEAEAEREGPALAGLLALPRGSTVLDLPCGWGRLSPALLRAGYRVFGGDLSPLNLQRLRRDFPVPAVPEETADEQAGKALYEYEPTEEAILAQLLPRNLSVQVFRSLLESNASEQGARMTAMDNATRNAGDMINSLTVRYNRSRQAQITKELIEIISGAEAL